MTIVQLQSRHIYYQYEEAQMEWCNKIINKNRFSSWEESFE